MEMFIIMILIIIFALLITYSAEIYLYVSLVLGSMINDVVKFFNEKKTNKKTTNKNSKA